MADTYRIQSDNPPSAEVVPAQKALAAARKGVPLPGEPARPPAEPVPAEMPPPPARLVSLDAYRGFIMTMLAASGFGILGLSNLPPEAPVWNVLDYATWQSIGFHFDHPAWESRFGLMGVSFWDLIQPAFMFMVGVAMPFSYARRKAFGESARSRLFHACLRGLVLVLMGVFLYSLGSPRTTWIFTNVLAQIGLGYAVVYLLLARPWWVQILALVGVLALDWGIMNAWRPPPDYDYAAVNASAEKGEVYVGKFANWSKNANAAHAFDRVFLNVLRSAPDADIPASAVRIRNWIPDFLQRWLFASTEPFTFNSGGYQTLNFLPSIATMLLGLLCGGLLLTPRAPWITLGLLVVAGAASLGLGLAAGEFLCPIVKRIWTPSWALFSGGYVIWMLAGFYLVFDILPLRKLAFPLVVVGMNSIAAYMLGQLLRGWTRDKIVKVHGTGILESLFGSNALQDDMFGSVIMNTCVFLLFWLTLYWMYRNRYFLRV